MTCSEFAKIWNEWLDDSSRATSSLRERLDAHASVCETCARLNDGFVRIAEFDWTPPAAPVDLAERLFQEWLLVSNPSLPPRVLRFPSWAIAVAGAAAACGLAIILTRPWTSQPDPVLRGESVPVVDATSPRPLSIALAEATSATIGLVREASEPAARVGQQMFLPSSRSDPTIPAASGLIPGPESLEAVGARVDSNVRTLSTTARRAFGFLGGSLPTPAQEGKIKEVEA